MTDLISSVSNLMQEAASTDPSILDRLATDKNVWLIDPLDGTANFANGVTPFAIMVALITNGDTVASWILDQWILPSIGAHCPGTMPPVSCS